MMLKHNLWLASAGMLLPAILAWAADPQLSLIEPAGAQRGTETQILLRGQRLADAQEILWYGPGVTVSTLKPNAQGRSVEATLRIAADTTPGARGLRLRTASGLSNLVTFSVGVLPEIRETEPNNDFVQVQKIPLDATVNGAVLNEDVDYFSVDMKKGQRLTAEIEGLRLGLDFFDPALAILNSRRFVVADADDTPAAWQDALCAIVAPDDDTYYIRVRESAYGGSSRSLYRLHVGDYPRPRAAFPAGGKLGQPLEVRWLGDPAGPWTEKCSLPAAETINFGLAPHDAHGTCPNPLPLRLSTLDNLLEAEPNNDVAQANPFAAPLAVNGVIDTAGDVDCFKFPGKKGQVLDVRVLARAVRSPLDGVLSIQNAKGRQLANNDDSNGPDSYLRFTVPADGDYVVRVTDQLGAGGPEYVYRVEVAPIEPQMTLTLPEREAFIDVTAPVPKGGRMAIMIGVQREDFGGRVDLELRGLPKGITADVSPIGEADTAVPVLLTAASDAALTGALAEPLGRTTEGHRSVVGRLRQRTSMIRGQNNREVWNYYSDRLAVAVTDAVPLGLEIVPSRAPLVQSGSKDIVVKVLRGPGFDGPVTLSMLYNPPGVSTTTAVTVDKGKSEGRIPLTADATARTGKSRILVLGQASIGGGTVTVASGFAELELSEPFVKLTFPTITVEQGQATELPLAVEQDKGFQGPAKAELLGLPGGVTTEPCEFRSDTTQIEFPLKTTAASPPGRHRSVLCRVVIQVAGEPVIHTLGPGELRILKPTPVAQAAPKKAAAPAPAAKPAKKHLSRLEQLRQKRE